MKKLFLVLISCGLSLGQTVYSAEISCSSLFDAEGDMLVALQREIGENELLQIDIDSEEVCTLERSSVDLKAQTSTAFHVNSELSELAIAANVEGLDTWLRVDSGYREVMLLDRVTSESLGLTDAEFLGDNSLLEASDFFIEYVSIELGALKLRSVETNIPHLEVPYDHYAGRGEMLTTSNPESEFLTVGTIGEALLEDFIITLDTVNKRMYMTEAE
ncbi:MAG: hypothetical protein HN872_03440 [Gammaproteobacteria bacterium]|nr:hypothetical protein [Gammaproteobacteria bacterium]MBT7225646.1 hypothetical protein [Gammaproteobacteria bacterium]